MRMRCVARMLLGVAAFVPAALAQTSTPRSGEAAAEAEATRIVLVASPALEGLASRFAAELSSLNFDVVRAAEAAEPQSPSVLEAMARSEQARAAVRVANAPGAGALDLWLVNPATHEVVYRRIVSERDPAVAVLRSLEILRGSLVDLRALAPAPALPATSEPTPPPRAAKAPIPPPRAAWFGLNAALTSRDARSTPAWGAMATFQVALAPKFWLHTEALVPLSEWHVSGQGGRVSAWAGAVTLGGSVAPWGERAVTPTLGLGVGALALHTRGEAAAGFRGNSDLNLVAFPHARLGLALRFTPKIRGKALFLAGFAAPRPVLLLAEERNSGWLNPLLTGALGLEVALE